MESRTFSRPTSSRLMSIRPSGDIRSNHIGRVKPDEFAVVDREDEDVQVADRTAAFLSRGERLARDGRTGGALHDERGDAFEALQDRGRLSLVVADRGRLPHLHLLVHQVGATPRERDDAEHEHQEHAEDDRKPASNRHLNRETLSASGAFEQTARQPHALRVVASFEQRQRLGRLPPGLIAVAERE